MKRHCICSIRLSEKYFYGCLCHHYSLYGPPAQSLMFLSCVLQRLLENPLASQFLLRGLGALIPQQIITNTVVSPPAFLFLKTELRFSSLAFFCTNITSDWESCKASKRGKALQGKSLGTFSEMGGLPFHPCSRRF